MSSGIVFHRLGSVNGKWSSSRSLSLYMRRTTRLCMVLLECNPSHLGVAFTRRSWRYMGASPPVHLYMVCKYFMIHSLMYWEPLQRVCKHSEVLWYLETPKMSFAHTAHELILVEQLCLLANQCRLSYNSPGARWSDLVLWHKQLLWIRHFLICLSLCMFSIAVLPLLGYMMFKASAVDLAHTPRYVIHVPLAIWSPLMSILFTLFFFPSICLDDADIMSFCYSYVICVHPFLDFHHTHFKFLK